MSLKKKKLNLLIFSHNPQEILIHKISTPLSPPPPHTSQIQMKITLLNNSEIFSFFLSLKNGIGLKMSIFKFQ